MFATKSLLRRSFISASHSKKFLIYRYRCQARRCRSYRLPTSPVLKATQHNEALESQTSQSLQSTLLCSVAKVTSRGLLQTEGAWLCQVLVNHEKVVRMTCPPPRQGFKILRTTVDKIVRSHDLIHSWTSPQFWSLAGGGPDANKSSRFSGFLWVCR